MLYLSILDVSIFLGNRYNDIICIDSTRIVLTQNVPPETDYIHANLIKMENVDRQFIATQGPLENTIGKDSESDDEMR